MFILYNIKTFFNFLFFKAFFKYKITDSFFLICFFIFISFLCIFFISIFIAISWRFLSFIFYLFLNFFNLFLILIRNWFLKNFFYLLTDLIFFLHRIRFSFFSGVSYYDPLLKIFSQNSAILKGEVLMDFYNFSNKFVFEDSFNLPVSIFSISSIFEPSRNFYFSIYLQQSFMQFLQTQNKIRTFFFYSKRFNFIDEKSSSKSNIVSIKHSFFSRAKKQMILTFLFFLNLCSIDFFGFLNLFQSLLVQNGTSLFKIFILKYFSFLKSCFLFVLINLENDSFLNYIYVTLYRLSIFNYVDKVEWKNLFNTYDLPSLSSLSYNGFLKYDFFFLFKVTFVYFFIYLNYFLFFLFSFFFFLLKFLYYFFSSFFSNNFLYVNYQHTFYNFFLLFICLFFNRFSKVFKYYKLNFIIPEFDFSSYFFEFDFFYLYFRIIFYYFILNFVYRLKVILSAFVFLIFGIRRYFPFYFLLKNSTVSFNFFINNFPLEKSFINSAKIYLIFSNIYKLSLKNYAKQRGRTLILSRFFIRYRYFFLFLQLKIFSLLKYDIYSYDSFFFYKIISLIRFLFSKIFSLIFFFRSSKFQNLSKIDNLESLSISVEDFQKKFSQGNFNFLKVILLINFFFELCLVFLFLLSKFFSQIFNLSSFYLFIYLFQKFFSFFFFFYFVLFLGFVCFAFFFFFLFWVFICCFFIFFHI